MSIEEMSTRREWHTAERGSLAAGLRVSFATTVAKFVAPQMPVQPSSLQAKDLTAAATERIRTWVELQHLRQVSSVWHGACLAQPAVQSQLFAEDRRRLREAASCRRHQYVESLAISAGLVCLAWLGYHVEPQKPRWGTAYLVGALSSLASGTIGIILEVHVPRSKAETDRLVEGLLKAWAIHFFGGLVLALVMPMMNSVGMPLAQLAAHHFVAAATLGKLVLGGWRCEWFALQLWIGAFICQLSWLLVAPTAFVVVLELVMGGLIALIPAGAVSE
mmetsp:Transcript_46208/g.108247  ORF Transcript_46208/g.108247 Transcript_46208/m.108247 type:complete len:276 (-) Transcript_46208:89-916(-)